MDRSPPPAYLFVVDGYSEDEPSSTCGTVPSFSIGSITTSGATVSITTEEADYGCDVILVATDGFPVYLWSSGDTTINAADTNMIYLTKPDTFWVEAIDAFGCSDQAMHIVGAFPSKCLTDAQDIELADSLLADSALISVDMKYLAKGMSGLSDNDTIKTLVKNIATENNDLGDFYHVYFTTLIDSCTAHSINLIERLQEVVWDNRETGTTPDTARIGDILPYFTMDDALETKMYPIISFKYLYPEQQDSLYPAWDTLSADFVTASVFHVENNTPSVTIQPAEPRAV